MTTLYYTRQLTKGILRGFVQNDSMSFISDAAAIEWVRGINKNPRAPFKIIDHAFQNYSR